MIVFDSSFMAVAGGFSTGVWKDGRSPETDEVDLDLSSCTYSLEHTFPGADLTSLGTIRILPFANDSQGSVRATVTVSIGDAPKPD